MIELMYTILWSGIWTVSKMECGLARKDSKVVRDPGSSPEFTTKNYEA